MYILGINAYHADGSTVLLHDGELIVALEEERFHRIKHWAGFPAATIQKCLEIGGITGADVSHVAISRDPRANLARKAAFAIRNRMRISNIVNRTRNLRKVNEINAPLAEALGVARDGLPRVHFVEHHPAHLASAFFVSPFDDFTIDEFHQSYEAMSDGQFIFISPRRMPGARPPRIVRVDNWFSDLRSRLNQ